MYIRVYLYTFIHARTYVSIKNTKAQGLALFFQLSSVRIYIYIYIYIYICIQAYYIYIVYVNSTMATAYESVFGCSILCMYACILPTL